MLKPLGSLAPQQRSVEAQSLRAGGLRKAPSGLAGAFPPGESWMGEVSLAR